MNDYSSMLNNEETMNFAMQHLKELGNEDIIKTLKCFRDTKHFPHLLLCGQPGIGKTTSVHCLAHEMLKENYKEAVLELNASDERGIDVIRTNIKAF